MNSLPKENKYLTFDLINQATASAEREGDGTTAVLDASEAAFNGVAKDVEELTARITGLETVLKKVAEKVGIGPTEYANLVRTTKPLAPIVPNRW